MKASDQGNAQDILIALTTKDQAPNTTGNMAQKKILALQNDTLHKKRKLDEFELGTSSAATSNVDNEEKESEDDNDVIFECINCSG